MRVSCPMCKRDYPVPEGVSRDQRFRCKCGCSVRLGELVDAETWAREHPPTLTRNGLLFGAAVVACLVAIVWARARIEPPPKPIEVEAPTIDRSPTAVLAGVDGRAERLARNGQHLEALRLYRSLTDAVRTEYADAIAEREDRLLTVLAKELIDKAAAAETPEQIRAVGPFAEEFLRKWAPDDREVPALRGLARSIDELKERLHESAPAEDDGHRSSGSATVELPPEPAARVARFAALAEEGRKRVQLVRARIDQERRDLQEARHAQAVRLRERTEKRPVVVPLSTGLELKNAQVVDFDLQTVRLKAPNQEVTLPWRQLPRQVALDLRALALRRRDPNDMLEFGTWCLKHQFYDEAAQAFHRAVGLDRSLQSVVPDVRLVRSRGQVFAGALDRTGNRITVDYAFANAREREDWSPIAPATQAAVQNGRLEVQGSNIFLTSMTEVGFDGHAEVTATIGRSSRADAETCFGILFGANTSRQLGLLVGVAPELGVVSLYRWAKGEIAPFVRKRNAVKGSSPRVTLRVRGRTVRVLVGRRTILRRSFDPEWNNTRVLVGGFAPSQAAVSVDALQIKGRLRSSWLRKSFGEIDAALFGLLQRRDELPIFKRSAKRSVPTVSAEDAYGLQTLAEGDRELFAKAKPYTTSIYIKDLREAIAAFSQVIRGSSRCAAAYYYRGYAHSLLREFDDATEDLTVAANLCPRFHEAYALRGLIQAKRGRLEAGLELAEQALAIRPDDAQALTARGVVRFYRNEDTEALADLEVARALDPWDDQAVQLTRAVGTVIQGPPWDRRYRTTTANFDVQTNISQDRADEYARHLEAIRGLYAKVFADDGELRPPARVLVFDTREGYYGYAELALDDRSESTLGMYVPTYRQLLLFEDKDDEDRHEVLDTLYHEGFHQFLDQLIPDADIPNWLNEGLAEYFGASQLRPDGEIQTGGVQEGRLQNLRWFVAGGEPIVPFPQLMVEEYAEFYAGNVPLKYAQAWSMVHFFRKGAPPQIRKRFLQYIHLLRKGQSRQAAQAIAWGDVDWNALQQAWWRYVQSLPSD